jgi:uncharacterized protein (DUF4415 family)
LCSRNEETKFESFPPERLEKSNELNMTVKKKHLEQTVTLVASLPDGTYIIEDSDGNLERRKSETDWARVDALTDEQIEESIRDDPDWSDDWNWGDAVLVIPPKKKAISIRVDEDVLDYFKGEEAAGYQRRINAVLRSYMQQKKSKKRKRA